MKDAGQYKLDSYQISEKRWPCNYAWARYIGQPVRIGTTSETVHGIITRIERYYTIIKDRSGREWVGTPYNTKPDKREEEQP